MRPPSRIQAVQGGRDHRAPLHHLIQLLAGEPYEIADWRNAKVHPDHHIQCQQALYSVPSDHSPPRPCSAGGNPHRLRRHTLLPWDGEPYEIADWRNAKVHPDHHIQCQQALYSVPSDRCPPRQQVEIRLGSKLVHIYHRGQLIKTHLRQPKGGRSTDPDDYPAELSAYTTRAPDRIQRSAATLGPAVGEYAERLFDGPLPWAKIRQGHKLLRLGERYTAQRLDAACRRALAVDLIDVRRLERILVQALEQEAMPQLPLPMPPGRFARPGSVFAYTAYRRQSA